MSGFFPGASSHKNDSFIITTQWNIMTYPHYPILSISIRFSNPGTLVHHYGWHHHAQKSPMFPGAMVIHRHVRYRFTPSPRRCREGRGQQLSLFSTLSKFSPSSLHFKYNHWLEISTRSILVCNSWPQLDPSLDPSLDPVGSRVGRSDWAESSNRCEPPEVLPARSTSDAFLCGWCCRHSLDRTSQTGHGAAGTSEKTLAVARPCESTGQT